MNRIAFVIGMLCLVDTALADSAASATMSNISFSLVDLNPADGVIPAIAFNLSSDYQSFVRIEAYERFDNGGVFERRLHTPGNGAFAPVAASFSPNAEARVSGNGVLEGATLTATGSSTGTIGGDVLYGANAAVSDKLDGWYPQSAFTLSPHSRVMFSADVEVSASVSAAPSSPLLKDPIDYARASASINVSDLGRFGYVGGPLIATEEIAADASNEPLDKKAGDATTIRQRLTLNLDNEKSDSLLAAVRFNAIVSGRSEYFVSVIPEPTGAFTFATGLALMGWRSVRQRFSARKKPEVDGWGPVSHLSGKWET